MKNRVFIVVSLAVVVAGFVYFTTAQKKQVETVRSAQPSVNTSTLIRFHNVSYGNAEAKTTVVEFFDPECESCREMHPIVKKLIAQYGNNVRFVLRYMPFHQNSLFAASALEEARELNKYDEALDLLFEKQPVWGDHHNPQPHLIAEFLQGIGIPKARLELNYLLEKHGQKIQIDKEDGQALGVNATPTIFVNGRRLYELGEEPLRLAIDQALAEAQ